MTTLPTLAHEAHGGDETPKPADCPVCEADLTYFLRWGEGRPDTATERATKAAMEGRLTVGHIVAMALERPKGDSHED